MAPLKPRTMASEPTMSDATILISVENLINIAMGPPHLNVINYKMLQSVLLILARQMRMLETQVEIRISELQKKPDKKRASSSSSADRSPQKTKDKHKKGDKDKITEGDGKPGKGKEGGRKDTPGREKGKRSSSSSISVTEVERDNEKILVVEKGPTTRTETRTARARVGSIEVVTMSQFELLESLVMELKETAGPMPMPRMPDNEELRKQLVKGTASLAQTMEAMQVQARVLAAEQAIGRIAGMVTALAAAGILPEDIAAQLQSQLGEAKFNIEVGVGHASDKPTGSRKSVAIHSVAETSYIEGSGGSGLVDSGPGDSGPGGSAPGGSLAGTEESVRARASTTPSATTSATSKASVVVPVSHNDMDNALSSLKAELTNNITTMTNKASSAAENAALTAKAVSDKLEVALQLNTRITHLHEMVTDYAEQLSGFDAGLTTQMQSFQEQMCQMRSDLKGGLQQLDQANNNAETAAVLELTERYEGLAQELDNTLTAHQLLTNFQKQLGDELRSLLEAVEMLREQKADRDEVLDGLRDKADLSRLAGLLTEQEFSVARAELERRLELCYDKFKKQEHVWMTALKDLNEVVETKAELMQLLAAKDEAEVTLNDMKNKLGVLFIQLGEPKAALLTRLLSRGGSCGACMVKALMEAADPQHGKPPRLPAPPPPGPRPPPEGRPCAPPDASERESPRPPGVREHTCQRWVGGSHTLLGTVAREKATPLPLGHGVIPSRKYTGIGNDGRMYMFEEECVPCVECNKMSTDEETGAGDNAVTTVIVAEKDCK